MMSEGPQSYNVTTVCPYDGKENSCTLSLD